MIQSIPWRYRCHRVCHLQMSLGSGIGQRAGAEPRRSAALDRRPMHRARNRTCCLSSRVSRSARRQAQPLWKDGRPIDARRRRYPDVRVLSSLSGRSGLELRLVHTAGFARYAQGAGFRLCPRARVEAKKNNSNALASRARRSRVAAGRERPHCVRFGAGPPAQGRLWFRRASPTPP
jgi:hypothetical protein